MVSLHNTANAINIVGHSPVSAKMVQVNTEAIPPAAVLLCAERRDGRQDQFHNLSGCVLRSLPLFLVVSGSSRQPPLTPFEATSCGEARHGERLFKRHSAKERRQRVIFNRAGVILGHLQ